MHYRPRLSVFARYSDFVGRLVGTSDPLGNLTFLTFLNCDALDDLTSIDDAMGGVTTFAYDADRDLTSVTDAKNGRTTYTFDPMDRRASRTDPLNAGESYAYDGNGNLIKHVDRRGKVTVYRYDGINRQTFAGFDQNGSQ